MLEISVLGIGGFNLLRGRRQAAGGPNCDKFSGHSLYSE